MQRTNECRSRALVLMELAKEAPELKEQLLYVAQKWLTLAALKSGSLARYEISEPRIMGYLRNNSVFTFGQTDRAKPSADFREILDAMWLFNEKFERALARYDEIRKQRKG